MRFLILVILLAAQLLWAQQVDREKIKNSAAYYWGEGRAETAQEATDQARAELTRQIAVKVASNFSSVVKETQGQELQESVQSILETHSVATLRNVRTDLQPTVDGLISAFCYLKKSEVEKIFNERRSLIADITARADEFARQLNMAFALKYYYFATVLLKSLPDENMVYRGKNYTTLLPEKINQIVHYIDFLFEEQQLLGPREKMVTLRVVYKGQPVALLDFFFWDGHAQVAVQAKDGLATFSLLGPSVKFPKLKVNVKYSYYEAREEIKAVADLWKLVNRPTFNTSKEVWLRAKSKSQKKTRVTSTPTIVSGQQQEVKNVKLVYEGENLPVREQIKKSLLQFVNVINSGSQRQVQKIYGKDKFLSKKLTAYMKYNQPQVIDKALKGEIHSTQLGYEYRKLRVLQRYPSIHKEATEYLVLDFNHQGSLIDFNASITENLYQEFVKQANFAGDWENRQQIIKFVEKYRTAYLTRDLPTIDLMFAEDALIIIGRKIKRKKLPDNMINYRKLDEKQPDYEYLKLTKKEFLKRQQKVFKAQQDIFLDFGTFNIVKKNGPQPLYGVEMRQSYFSTTYSDQGYLFLLIDFSYDDPLIYVRAWQPKAWSKEELVKTANFRMFK